MALGPRQLGLPPMRDVRILDADGNLVGGPSGVSPLAGSQASSALLGPFSPSLGRPIWLTLSGVWSGSVTVKRSVDGGATKLVLTAGGQSWAVFTANANEQVAEPSESGETYYLDVTLVSGTLTYRMAQ